MLLFSPHSHRHRILLAPTSGISKHLPCWKGIFHSLIYSNICLTCRVSFALSTSVLEERTTSPIDSNRRTRNLRAVLFFLPLTRRIVVRIRRKNAMHLTTTTTTALKYSLGNEILPFAKFSAPRNLEMSTAICKFHRLVHILLALPLCFIFIEPARFCRRVRVGCYFNFLVTSDIHKPFPTALFDLSRFKVHSRSVIRDDIRRTEFLFAISRRRCQPRRVAQKALEDW